MPDKKGHLEDWEISANKAEEIWEKKQKLKDLKNYRIKLDVKRTFAEIYDKDPQKFQELDARYNEINQKIEDLQREID